MLDKITALQIRDIENTIKEIIKKKIISFNLGRIRTAYKKHREKTGNNILTEQEKNEIKQRIINDETSQKYREQLYNRLKTEFENYKHIRNNINNINDMSVDAVEIEKCGLLKPMQLGDLYSKSLECNEIAVALVNFFREKYYYQNNNEKLQDDFREIELMFEKIYTMYDVDIEASDIDVIMKYGYESNVDIVNKYSDLISKQNYSVFNRINNTKTTISNKLLSYLFSDEITNNTITLFQNTYSSNTKLDKNYRLRTLGELLFIISNKKYKHQTKTERFQLYINNDASRPSENEYKNWTGLQVYDIDLKEWIKDGGDIETLKIEIHKILIDYHWYLWISKSASGRGLHIYTKVAPPHHIYIDINENEKTSKYWYNVNYVSKLNIVYKTLQKTKLFPNEGFINKYVDNVVSRISAGIRLSYDENPYVNNNFLDLQPQWLLNKWNGNYKDTTILNDFHQVVEELGLKAKKHEKLARKKLKIVNDLWYDIENPDDTQKENNALLNFNEHIKVVNDITVTKSLNSSEINYFTRYNVCNTLASIAGVNGLTIAHDILRSTELGNVDEINAFYSCALSNNKQPTKLGLQILKKVGFIKNVSKELTTEIQTGFKHDLKREIQKVLVNELPEIDINLKNNEYIGHYSEMIKNQITGEKINIIFSPPGTGKTEWIKQLAREGKKILLVLPFISIIQNKIESDKEIQELFDIFYGSINIKDIEYGRNAVTTFDKFSRINYDKIAHMFDYIFIDESHLLFTSSYRIEATSNAIKKIKELYYISSNDELSAKLVLMTGTETGESHFFKNVSNIIRITKKQPNKNMQFVLADTMLDGLTRMAYEAKLLLEDGYKLLIPTNKGEIYTEKFIGMLSYLMKREIKYGYYKRSNNDQLICRLINEKNTVGDFEVIFSSNYLSVGVDINDNVKFASLYIGNFAGYEIEQFNARIRKTGIESRYFVITEKENGDIYTNLIQEPNLVLKITDNDKLFFIDDKSIASAKTEFIADYDPILKRITTPGFSLLNGKIQFNLEEYELISFENKYIESMEHPVKVARELAKYGYNVSINEVFEGLSEELKIILKETGIKSAKEEKLRKHQLLINTFYDLINNNVYINKYGLEFTNVIEWIAKHQDLIVENREAEKHVEVIFNTFAAPQEVIVKSKEALDKIIGYARYLIKQYSVTKSIEIFDRYVENGMLKINNFKRAINLLKLINSSDNDELSEPLTKTIEKIYKFVDDFESSPDYFISYNTYQATLDKWTNEYIDMLGIKIHTVYGWDKIKNSILELILDISKKSHSKKGIRFTYNKLPNQDSSTFVNRATIDSLVNSIFNVTGTINKTNKIKSKHIVLKEQKF